MKKVIKGVLALALLGVIAFAGFKATVVVKELDLFKVKHVEVRGVINASKASLEEVGKQFVGLSIFDSKLKEVVKTDDKWVQSIEINRVLPDKINLVVYEEKALFKYKNRQGKCFFMTVANNSMPTSCDNVNITLDKNVQLDLASAKSFANMLEKEAYLKDKVIILKDYRFDIVLPSETIRCPYNYKMFVENLNTYLSSVRKEYRHIDYADLTINKRLYVKGVR